MAGSYAMQGTNLDTPNGVKMQQQFSVYEWNSLSKEVISMPHPNNTFKHSDRTLSH